MDSEGFGSNHGVPPTFGPASKLTDTRRENPSKTIDAEGLSSDTRVLERSAAEAAACKCAAAGLSPAFRGVPDSSCVVPEVMPTLC